MKVVIPVGALHIGGGCRVLADVANALTKAGHDAEVVIPEGMPIEYNIIGKLTIIPALDKAYIPPGDIVLPNFYTTFQPAYEAWPEQCVRLSLGFEPYWVPDPDHAIWTYAQGVPTISISHWLDDQIYNHVHQRGLVVNLGVNPEVFYPKSGKEQHKRKIILYMARDPEAGYALKGFDDFARAMGIFNQQYTGKYRVYMICPERVLSLSGIPYKTFVPSSDVEIADLYRRADVFVSTSWFEGFALPPLEAMACGTPVVTTNSGGVLDFCAHKKSAYITEPHNSKRIARGMMRVLENKRLNRRLVAGGLASANRLTSQQFEYNIVRTLENMAARIQRKRLGG